MASRFLLGPRPSYSWVGVGCGMLETIQVGVICH